MPDSVLVTGCTAGSAGEGLALAFQARGLHVFATARKLSNLENLAKLPNVTTLALDVTSPESIAAVVEVVKKTGDGKLKYLINNAGLGIVAPVLDTNIDEGRKMFEVNYWGAIAMIQAFVPFLVASKGTIANIGSGAGNVTIPWVGVYGSSKAAFQFLSEVLRLEVEPLGVKVLTVVAGSIKTNFFTGINETYALPPDSYYSSLKNVLIEKASGKADFQPSTMTAEAFGRAVAADVLSGKKGNTYRGSMAWAVPIMEMMPKFVQDWYCRDRGRVKEFKQGKTD